MADINQFLKDLLKDKEISKPLPKQENVTPHYREFMEFVNDLNENSKVVIAKAHVDLLHDDGRAVHLDMETGEWEFKRKDSDNYRKISCAALTLAAVDIRESCLNFMAGLFGATSHIYNDHT